MWQINNKNMKYSIIIPVIDNERLTIACLNSIQKNTTDYEIIVVDNGSKIPFCADSNWIRNEKNMGFPIAINQGIRKSSGDIIILLNNDTIVSPHWTEYLTEHLKNYDMIGPLTNNISGVQQLILKEVELPEKTDIVAEGIHKTNAGKSMPYHRIVFFCVAIKREVINKIGELDEIFTPGNCEDDDYCLRAIEAGFKLGIAEDCFIYHKGSASKDSYTVEYSELLTTNMAKFKTKWPREKYDSMIKKNIENCKEIQTKQKRSLAVVMIAKNEEMGIKRAILSVKDFADEIIIAIDSASTDKTAEIAFELGATIRKFNWCDDFAWARNFAQEEVKSDWILYLDGHEYVTKHERLEQMLTTPADTLLCSIILENEAVVRSPRIYRKGLKFEGKIHEIPNYNSTSVYSDFVIAHGRLDGQAKEAIELRKIQTNDMVPRIMGKQLEEDQSNTRASMHLALHYQTKGDYKKAFKMQKIYLKYAKHKGERWMMYFNRALCHFALNNKFRALWATDKAEKETPNRWEIAKLRGMIFFKQENFKDAIDYLVASFDENTGDTTYKPWQRNNAETWNIIGECFFNTGKYEQAEEAFREATRGEKDTKKRKFYNERAELMYKIKNEN